MTNPRTTGVIVVNWNDPERTRRCLSSLFAMESSDIGVCVIDNGSAEDGTAIWRGEFPRVQVIRLDQNRGYAGACNAGIAWAERQAHRYVLFLNNDTTVAADVLTVLVARSQELADQAILAPKILASGEPDRIWSAGGRLRWPWLEREHIGMGEAEASYNRPHTVDWASGCALFVPLSLAKSIGGLDERYFLYLEDVEWSLRARRHGHRVWYVPRARIWHDVSGSVARTDPRLLRYYACRNYYLLVFAHGGIVGRAWAAGRLTIATLKSGLRLLLFPSYRKDPSYIAQTRALIDVVRRRSGKAPYAHRIIASQPAPEASAG